MALGDGVQGLPECGMDWNADLDDVAALFDLCDDAVILDIWPAKTDSITAAKAGEQ
nr:hypothetical protein [Rhizobium sp. T1473]